jgi:hypothetical protein
MSDRDRDCERSECDSGRGVISDASSKLSCYGALMLAWALEICLLDFVERNPLTASLSELCALVGLSGFLSSSILLGLLVARFLVQGKPQSMQQNRRVGAFYKIAIKV